VEGMETYLGYWIQADGNNVLIKGDDITEKDVIEFEKKCESINNFLLQCSFFDMLLKNFSELMETLDSLKKNQKTFTTELEVVRYLPEVNRLLINALGSFHIYSDNYDRYQKRTGEIGVTPGVCWRNDPCRITSQYYREYFIYRFFYKLRNFSVHCAIPVTSMVSTEDAPTKQLFISKTHLIDNNSFDWGDIKNEINNDINLLHYIYEFIIMIKSFHKKAVSPMLENVHSTLCFFDNLAKNFTDENGEYRKLPNIITIYEDEEIHLNSCINLNVPELQRHLNTLEGMNT